MGGEPDFEQDRRKEGAASSAPTPNFRLPQNWGQGGLPYLITTGFASTFTRYSLYGFTRRSLPLWNIAIR